MYENMGKLKYVVKTSVIAIKKERKKFRYIINIMLHKNEPYYCLNAALLKVNKKSINRKT